MIEERARVVAVEDGHVWVETQRRSTCDACSASKGCGTAVIGKAVGRRRSRVRAVNRAGARVGDEVTIALAEDAFLRGSAAMYLMPLLLMFALAWLGQQLAPMLQTGPDVAAGWLGLLGLAAGFGWVARFARAVRQDSRYQPVILRILPRSAAHN